MLNANIQASDIYGYYQSKYLRQTARQLAADQLESQLAAAPAMPDAARARNRGYDQALARRGRAL